MTPTWFEVARRPRYIFGLLFALLVAVIFSLLGQWQLSRTFQTVGISQEESKVVPIQDLVTAGEPITKDVMDRLVSAEVMIDYQSLYIIANRIQLRENETFERGYWLIANSNALIDEKTFSLTLALAYSKELSTLKSVSKELAASLQAQSFLPIEGLLEPTEGAKPQLEDRVLETVSLGQLVNLYSDQPIVSFPAYVIVRSGWSHPELEEISLKLQQEQTRINWLTAFYALEWAFFALAAFYLWWRVVQDQVIRERAGLSPEKG